MSHHNLSHIRAVVWDLDGTLYQYDDNFVEVCNMAAARTVIEMGLDMAVNDAMVIARKSQILYGSSFKLFAEHGLKYEDFHLPYHDSVDTTVIQKAPAIKAALEALKIPMVVLTNASRTWAKKTLDHLEFNHIFGDGNILSLEDVGYQAKAHSTAGFEKALSIMGVQAGETLMVEDLARNLPKAKELGMATALVLHGQVHEEDQKHVDFVFDNTLDLARTLAKNL